MHAWAHMHGTALAWAQRMHALQLLIAGLRTCAPVCRKGTSHARDQPSVQHSWSQQLPVGLHLMCSLPPALLNLLIALELLLIYHAVRPCHAFSGDLTCHTAFFDPLAAHMISTYTCSAFHCPPSTAAPPPPFQGTELLAAAPPAAASRPRAGGKTSVDTHVSERTTSGSQERGSQHVR